MQYFVIFLFSYLVGSIPTAYLVLKKTRSLDIREHGSGNVGTLNSFEVSNSKMIGVVVLLSDLIKGIIVVKFTQFYFGNDFNFVIVSLISAVLGHCYSIWLNFKGGRGLATTAGGSLFIFPLITFLWLIFWLISYTLRKHIHLSNIFSTVMVLLVSIIFGKYLNNLSFIVSNSVFIFSFSVSLLMLIILSKHISPLIEIINQKRQK